MKDTRLLTAAVVASISFPSAVIAGPLDPVAVPLDGPSIVSDDSWVFELRPYLWTVNLEGNVGMNGIVAPVDLSFGDILSNLDFAWAGTFSAQKGKWSVIFDSNYIKLSTGIDKVPFPLFSTVGIEVEQVLLSASLFYRVAEWDRGFFDIGAGAQYMYMKNEFSFSPSDSGIAEVSDRLAVAAVDKIAGEVRRELGKRLAGIVPPGPPPVAKPLARLGDRIAERVETRDIERSVRETLNSSVAARANDKLGSDVLKDGVVKRQIRELASAAAKEQIAATTSGAKSAVARKAAAARKKAERKLSQALQKEIKRRLPDGLEVSEGWVDPFVAARVRHFLTDRIYVNAFGAYGGFGVGSDSMWQVGAGPGFIVNDWLTLELYYRHLSVDYEGDDFLFDATMSGVFLGAVIQF